MTQFSFRISMLTPTAVKRSYHTALIGRPAARTATSKPTPRPETLSISPLLWNHRLAATGDASGDHPARKQRSRTVRYIPGYQGRRCEELVRRVEVCEPAGPHTWTRENRLFGLKSLPVRLEGH